MQKDISQVIRMMAKQEGVSEQTFLDELQRDIDAGYSSADPEVRARWEALPFDGRPTPIELLLYWTGQ